MPIEVNHSKVIHDPKTRKYVYGIVIALVPLLTTLGIITEDVAGHVLLIAAAVLGIGGPALAAANVGEPQAGPEDVDLEEDYPGGEMMDDPEG